LTKKKAVNNKYLSDVNRSNKRKVFLVSDKLHPQTIACVETRCSAMSLKTKIVDLSTVTEVEKDISAVLFQYPDTNGSIQNFQNLIDKTHAAGVIQIKTYKKTKLLSM
jgi:glycine dehydrogenase